jgi:hypothetical protein
MAKKSKNKAKKKQANSATKQAQLPASFDAAISKEVAKEMGSYKNLAMDEASMKMRESIIASLGEGYDDRSLQVMDRKLCNFFLPNEEYESDDEGEDDNTSNKNNIIEGAAALETPTDDEIELYFKSTIIRMKVLRKASSFKCLSNFLAGHGNKNLQEYQDLYDDIKTYYYAWFEIIFKEDNGSDLLLQVSKIMSKFAFVTLESKEGTTDDAEKIMELLIDINDLYQMPIKEDDKEACENAGHMEYDFYELCYKLSIKMAKANKEDDAETYFKNAYTLERCYHYEDCFCFDLLVFASTGTDEEYIEMSEEMNIDRYPGFIAKCLKAYVNNEKGSVPFNDYSDMSENFLIGNDDNVLGNHNDNDSGIRSRPAIPY